MLDTPATPLATLVKARQIAIDNGVHYAYTGNVHDAAGSSTWCHGCGELLIERDWYRLGRWGLDPQGRCRACQTPLPGHFDATAGGFGARRIPVRLDDVSGLH
jgi:pyruvate formate lyase activating enzyme